MLLEDIAFNVIGIKPGKDISEETISILLNCVAKKISEVDTMRNMEEIRTELDKVKRIRQMQRTERASTIMAAGMYSSLTKNIFLDEHAIENIKTGEISRVTMHEFIHSLQKGRQTYHGKDIKGIVEGSTESYTDKIFKPQRSQQRKGGEILAKVNYPPITAYVENMSIVNQLEIVLGGNLIEKLALQGKPDAFKQIIEEYGKDFFETIRKGTNEMLTPNMTQEEKIILQQKLQNKILTVCYEKKYSQIQNIQDAVQYFEKLKKIELERFKIKGDNTFKEFYSKKHNNLMQRFYEQGLDIGSLEALEYTEAQFYPTYTEQEKENAIQERLKSIVYNKNEQVDNLKRYRIKQDDKYYDVVVNNEEPIAFTYISDTEMLESRNYFRKETQGYAANAFCGKYSKICIGINERQEVDLLVSNLENDENTLYSNLQQIELGFTQEEVDKLQEKQAKQENKKTLSILGKIKQLFQKKPKALPPANENTKIEKKVKPGEITDSKQWIEVQNRTRNVIEKYSNGETVHMPQKEDKESDFSK